MSKECPVCGFAGGSQSRSVRHHKWLFKLLSIVADASGQTTERILFMLKIRLGYVDSVMFRNGDVLLKPRSISFGKMSEREFTRFCERAVDAVITEWLPGTKREDLKARVMELVS